MKYKATLDWMFSKLPMYQRQGKTAFKKDLTNTIALEKHLGNPHLQFKSIHVAGTNGKGSTSHMLASILQEAGYKVGLYTSPHLKDFRERIKINGKAIHQNSVINFVKRNQRFLETQGLSFFEMTVGMAFYYFANKKVDIAIVEVGLGGRLDSTNIITPEISLITNIGYDHTQFLGETLEEIAFEKAGIIKPTVPVVISETQTSIKNIFKNSAKKNASEIYFADISNLATNYKTDLLGSYQQKNMNGALKAIEILNKKGYTISSSNIKYGLLNVVKNTGLLGRWQVVNQEPKIICDTAHNKEGLNYVLKQLKREKYNKLHIVMGVVNDKNLETILPLFPKNAKYYFCKPTIPRGLEALSLMKEASKFALKGQSFSSVQEAYKSAQKNAKKNDLIFVGGSTFVVAEVL